MIVVPRHAESTELRGCAERDPLDALRASTAARHRRLDRSMPLSRERAGLDDYAQHMRLMRDWLQPLQAWLAAMPGEVRDLGDGIARRLQCIDGDLAWLGKVAAPGAIEDDAVAASLALPPAANAKDLAWGVAYVIEGSQLGGAMLHRRFAAAFAPFVPASLAADARDGGARWTRFLVRLRAGLREPAAIDAACRGACLAFDRLLARVPAAEIAA